LGNPVPVIDNINKLDDYYFLYKGKGATPSLVVYFKVHDQTGGCTFAFVQKIVVI
jgi:hypothetical protein